MPASFLPEPHQAPIRKGHIPQCNFASETAHPQGCSAHFNFRAETANCIAGGYAAFQIHTRTPPGSPSFLFRFLNVIYFNSVPASFLSEPRQTPTRKSHIPQCTFASKAAHLQCCSAHFNFRADTAACIAGGLCCIQRVIYPPYHTLTRFPSHTYRIPMRRLPSFLNLMSLPTIFPSYSQPPSFSFTSM